MDFGNGTTLTSFVVPGYNNVVLHETMTVDKSEITATPEDLLEDDFLCYKVFKIQFGVEGKDSTSDSLSKFSEMKKPFVGNRGFDPTWSVRTVGGAPGAGYVVVYDDPGLNIITRFALPLSCMLRFENVGMIRVYATAPVPDLRTIEDKETHYAVDVIASVYWMIEE